MCSGVCPSAGECALGFVSIRQVGLASSLSRFWGHVAVYRVSPVLLTAGGQRPDLDS